MVLSNSKARKDKKALSQDEMLSNLESRLRKSTAIVNIDNHCVTSLPDGNFKFSAFNGIDSSLLLQLGDIILTTPGKHYAIEVAKLDSPGMQYYFNPITLSFGRVGFAYFSIPLSISSVISDELVGFSSAFTYKNSLAAEKVASVLIPGKSEVDGLGICYATRVDSLQQLLFHAGNDQYHLMTVGSISERNILLAAHADMQMQISREREVILWSPMNKYGERILEPYVRQHPNEILQYTYGETTQNNEPLFAATRSLKTVLLSKSVLGQLVEKDYTLASSATSSLRQEKHTLYLVPA